MHFAPMNSKTSVLTLEKTWSFTPKEVLFYPKRPPLLQSPLREKSKINS